MTQRRLHHAIRKFFEGRLWPCIVLGMVVLNLALDNLLTAIGNVAGFVAIHAMHVWLRSKERVVARERQQFLDGQRALDQKGGR